MVERSDDDAVLSLRAAVADAVETLRASGARDEALAEYVPRRRSFMITREPVLRPIGRVWRLGVLLVTTDGRLLATGSLVRATPPGRPQYQSVSAETRRAFRAAAQRGHFAEGETVNFDARPIELTGDALRSARVDGGPVFLRDGAVFVSWSPSAGDAGAREFAGYLSERVDLLAHPPEGA